MERDSIPENTKRELWAQCGGYCQNPNCNKYLFAKIDDDLVSLANIAHIIGLGNKSPRSEHELARFIDKNGTSNLIMLCLDCHKIVDELEHKYSVEELHQWKSHHFQRIKSSFEVPNYSDEMKLFREISEILDENRQIFETYGPFSRLAWEGDAGDTEKIWRRKCLDTLIPNNQRIIDIFEKNKKNFSYPWEAYRQMMYYKIHADSFKENCIIKEKINDYKQFPLEFDYYIKTKLGIKIQEPEIRRSEEINFRSKTIDEYINRFLAKHDFIANMKKLNICMFVIDLIDGRNIRAFVTNTYFFTEYTLDKILTIDPNIDVIICSNPYGQYTDSAKQKCIEESIGLFMLKEFMGAIRTTGDRFFNYLVNEEKNTRVINLKQAFTKYGYLRNKCNIYVIGSYIRSKIYNDIDIIVVYKNAINNDEVRDIEIDARNALIEIAPLLHLMVCSEGELENYNFYYNDKIKIL